MDDEQLYREVVCAGTKEAAWRADELRALAAEYEDEGFKDKASELRDQAFALELEH